MINSVVITIRGAERGGGTFGLLGRPNTYMANGRGKRPLGVVAAPARPDDGLVAMEVDLGFQLIPQLVVRGPLHVAAEQLNLLHSLK